MSRTMSRRVAVGALMVAGAGIVPALPTGAVPTVHAVPASSVDGHISVRLVGMDGETTTGVISATSGASWNGSTGYAALKAERIGSNEYRVSASSQRTCPGASELEVPNGFITRGATGEHVEQLQAVLGTLGYAVGPVDGIFGEMTEAAVEAFQDAESLKVDGAWKNVDATRARELLDATGVDGWTELGVAEGPITFTTAGSETDLAPGDTLGVCRPNGQVIHYRGAIRAVTDPDSGSARTVNALSVENYLRGVLPREVSASWGDAGGGAGMNALRAQAVGARSYALSQDRYSYAETCDTTACQAYGGAARRTGAAASAVTLEDPRTDQAISETAGRVRVWDDGSLVSTEYSASNGPRTAGGSFPAVDDEADSVPANPNHRWTRIRSASALASSYGLSPLTDAATPTSSSMTDDGFEGIWARYVRLRGGSPVTTRSETAWNFRGAQGFPSPGFEFRRVEGRDSSDTVALIGDSVSRSILNVDALQPLLDGAFASTTYDAQVSRPIGPAGNPIAGISLVEDDEDGERVPEGTDLVIVQLGYNDGGSYGQRIDEMIAALEDRDVGQIAWVNLSTRSSSKGSSYAQFNAALAQRSGAVAILDWNGHSSGAQKDRWFSDGVHLTATGRAEFARFLNDRARDLTSGTDDGTLEAVVVEGVGNGHGRGMSQWGAYGWAVNHGWTWEQILDHYYGGTSLGTVAVSGDVPQVVDQKVLPTVPLRAKLAGRAGVPDDGSAAAVALNVTAVDPDEPGFLTVWPCASDRPEASNVNYLEPGGAEPNSVLVQLDETGDVCVYSYAPAHVLIDVAGWFSSGFDGIVPNRVVDTRGGQGAPAGKVAPAEPLRVDVGAADPPEEAGAVALNVTAVDPDGPGFLTVWPCGSDQPVASNVNYLEPGGAEPNAVLVQLDETGEVCVYTEDDAHVLVDVAGWFTSGFEPVVPERVVDTRNGIGAAAAKVASSEPLRFGAVGVAGVPDDGTATAVALNVTAVDPDGPGFLTVWPCASDRPEASNVNYLAAGAVEPNSVLVRLDETGEVCVYTEDDAHVLVDVAGWFSGGFEGIVPERVVDTRSGLGR